jgi:hypothetical protein
LLLSAFPLVPEEPDMPLLESTARRWHPEMNIALNKVVDTKMALEVLEIGFIFFIPFKENLSCDG